ncbi:MAG TPA: hypothetical protein VMB53_02445 [Gaiellaceae bacterium]|nr:hypothetical protein [Gaiellaceae bacterium]
MDPLRKTAAAFVVVILFFYMGIYALGSAVVGSKCPADTDFPVFCTEQPNAAKALALGIGALLCLVALVCAGMWMTRQRHWYHAVALSVGVGACLWHPTVWAGIAAAAAVVAVVAPLIPDTSAVSVAGLGRSRSPVESVSPEIFDLVAGIDRLPAADLRTLGSALLAGALIVVGDSRLAWSGLADTGLGRHRLLVGPTDVRVAIAVALLAVVALAAGLAAAALVSRHPARTRATVVALLALSIGLYLGGRWNSAVPTYAGVGVAIALAVRCTTRSRMAVRLVAAASVAPLATLLPGSGIAAPIMLVALAIPAADYVVTLWEYATETR